MYSQKNNQLPTFASDPPILPGDHIKGPSECITIFPRFNNDSTDITNWMFTTGTTSCDQAGYKEYILADGKEIFCTEFTSIRNPVSGKEELFSIGSKDIYNITLKTDGSPQINKTPRPDPNPLVQSHTVCFFSSVVVDIITRGHKNPIYRYLYVAISADSNQTACIYDAKDTSFKRELPFIQKSDKNAHLPNYITKPVAKIVKFPANKRTYWGFLFRDIKEDTNVKQGVYTILESVALAHKENTFSVKNFFVYPLQADPPSESASNANPIVDDLLSDCFYTDEENLGANQLALIYRTDYLTPKFSIKLLSLNSKNKFSVVDTLDHDYSLKPASQEVILDSLTDPVYKILRNPNGDISIIAVTRTIQNLKVFSLQTTKVSPNVIGNAISLINIIFDSGTKKFSLKGVTPQWAFNQNDFYPQSNFVSIGYYPKLYFEFNKPDYSKKKMSTMSNLYITFSVTPAALSDFPLGEAYTATQLYTFYIKLDNYVVTIDKRNEYVIGINKNSPTSIESEKYQYSLFSTGVEEGRFIGKLVFRRSDIINKIGEIIDELSCFQKGYYSVVSSDLLGENPMVGVPKLTIQDTVQIFGCLQCIPFEDSVAGNSRPMLMVASTKDVMTGYHKSTTSSWHSGDTSSTNFQLGALAVNAHYSKSWGGSDMHMSSDQTNISIHISANVSTMDAIQAYGSTFYLWEYPIYAKSVSQNHIGILSVLIPDGFGDQLLWANDPRFDYNQDYEIGKVLTYLDAHKPDYDVKNILFEPVTISVGADQSGGSTTVAYNKNNTTQTEDSKTTEDSVNAGASLSLHKGGFGASFTGFYSKSHVENSSTSTTKTKDLGLTFQSGSVKDNGFIYTIRPVVYNTPKGLLMVTYDVELSGKDWHDPNNPDNPLGKRDIILFRVYPYSKDVKLNKFTRSIRFHDNADGSTDIEVIVFGNSILTTNEFTCEVYKGMASYPINQDPDVSKCTLITTLKADKIQSAERLSLYAKNIKLEKKTVITVKLFLSGLEDFANYYWGIYPYEAFSTYYHSMIKENK